MSGFTATRSWREPILKSWTTGLRTQKPVGETVQWVRALAVHDWRPELTLWALVKKGEN